MTAYLARFCWLAGFMLDSSLNSMFQSNRRSISCNFTDESINATVALRFNQESSNTMNAVTLVRNSWKTTRSRIFHAFWSFWQMNNGSHIGTPLLIPWTNSFRSKDCSKRGYFCKNYFALCYRFLISPRYGTKEANKKENFCKNTSHIYNNISFDMRIIQSVSLRRISKGSESRYLLHYFYSETILGIIWPIILHAYDYTSNPWSIWSWSWVLSKYYWWHWRACGESELRYTLTT